jgi:hypothetical protein
MRRWALLSAGAPLAIGLAVFAAAGSASGTAIPIDQSPPSIDGTPQEGSVLNAGRGRWASATPVSYAYQWRRCLADGTGCADVPSATDRIYAAGTADVGHTVRVAVTATNRDGSAAAVSAATATVTALGTQAPHNTAPAGVTGSAAVGRVLTATAGTWTGSTPMHFSYRWRRCNASGGDCEDTLARGQAHKVSADDGGRTLRVLVTARNPAGAAAALSSPTAPVTRPAVAAPQATSAPRISGTVQQGQQLRGDRGSWRNSPTGFTYSWLRCDGAGAHCSAIPGAHQTVYSVASGDVGHTIRFEVDARNAGGTTRAFSAPSAAAAVAPVAKSPPGNTAKPTISGTAQEGQTLTGSAGTWTNSPTKFDYSWRRCNQNGSNCDGIGGAHGTTYTLTSADIGKRIRFRVKASNADGSRKAESDPTAVVRAAAKPGSSSPPTISGTAAEGSTLNGSKGSWTHSPSSFDYAWLRCDRNGNNCGAISGARGASYVLTSADVGSTVRFRVTATNSEGSTTATSVPTAVVQKPQAPLRGPGCPAGSGNPDQVAGITPPARLLVDSLQSDPRVVSRSTSTLVVRFHVTSTCGGSVQGALVYATAIPYNQFSIPPEAATGSDGWATLVFRRLSGFPVSSRQQLIAMFVRARKPGEPVLSGISTRRLFSIPVRLG